MEASSYNPGEVLNFKVLTFFGYWHVCTRSSSVQLYYSIYSTFVLSMITIYLLLQLADLKDSMGTIELLSANLTATSTSVFSLSNVYFVRYWMQRIEKIREDFNAFLNVAEVGSDEEDIEIFKKYGSNFTRTCKSFYTLVGLTVFLWCIFPAMNGFLPVRLWLPFDAESNANLYTGVYLYECALLVYYGGIVITCDLLQFTFITSVSAHFEVMKKNLRKYGMEIEADMSRDLTFEQRRKNAQEKLWKLVGHHQQILRVAQELDIIFRITNLIHLIGVGILISVCEFDIIQKTSAMDIQSIAQSGNAASAICDLFIYSYYGSMLQESSFDISRALYEFPWHVLDPSSRRIVLFMLSRSQKPTMITAGRIVAINLATYLSIMRHSYNLLALLRQTR